MGVQVPFQEITGNLEWDRGKAQRWRPLALVPGVNLSRPPDVCQGRSVPLMLKLQDKQ